MTYSAADFLLALQQLLPRGRAWPRDPGAVLTRALATLMPTYARLAERDFNLLVDAFPATADELLPEWEAALGLPDPCAGASPTIQQRQAQVLARFAYSGGQSVAYFTAFAKTLGYTVTIDQFAPAVAGRLRAGQPVNGMAWAYAWRVNVPSETITYFRAGVSAAGEPLTVFGNDALLCEIGRLAPAHTVALFAAAGSGTIVIGGGTTGDGTADWSDFYWSSGTNWG